MKDKIVQYRLKARNSLTPEQIEKLGLMGGMGLGFSRGFMMGCGQGMGCWGMIGYSLEMGQREGKWKDRIF